MKFAAALLTAGAWLLLLPDAAHAWGPGTHIAIGEGVLKALLLLPPATRVLLERYPLHFLYGSVAADISFAKKYAPVGRHCHHWHIGEEIFETADTEPMGAVALGYLAHLAADTIAHNLYVPRRLLLTSTTQTLGHTYWEHRMDVHLGEEYLGKARRLVLEHDHAEADALFDTVLSRTLFSFNTNRRLFRGMMLFQDNEHWKQVFDRILQKSRFDIPDPIRDRYLELSFDFVMDYLVNRHESRAAALDPIGEMHLRLAKMVRRRGLATGGRVEPGVLEEMADDFFPLPEGPLLYVPHALAEAASAEAAGGGPGATGLPGGDGPRSGSDGGDHVRGDGGRVGAGGAGSTFGAEGAGDATVAGGTGNAEDAWDTGGAGNTGVARDAGDAAVGPGGGGGSPEADGGGRAEAGAPRGSLEQTGPPEGRPGKPELPVAEDAAGFVIPGVRRGGAGT